MRIIEKKRKIKKQINFFRKSLLLTAFLLLMFVVLGAKDAAAETRTKTVEFFIGQDQTSGTGVAANAFWSPASFTVDLPDAISSSTTVKSAWVEYVFQGASTSAPGVVTLGLTPAGLSETTFTSVSYATSGENYSISVRADFTNAVQTKIQSAGAASFGFRARVAGTARKMENAKMFVTYEYNSNAATQINTIHYRIGQSAGNVAVGTTGSTFTSPSFIVGENSPTVVSAWSEIKGHVPATSTTDNTFAVSYDSDTASNYYLDNVGGTDGQLIHILHSKPSITLNTAHTLKIAAIAGYQMNLISAEQIITYKFNYTNSTSLTVTRDIMLGSDGNKASSIALDVNTSISIPEDSPSIRNVYLRGTAHAASSTTLGLAAKLGSSIPSPGVSFSYTAATEAMSNFWVLSDEINDLSSMVKGDNAVSARFSGTMTSRSMMVVFTYTYAKSSSVRSGSAKFFGDQQTAYGTSDTAAVPVSISGTVQSGSYSSYLRVNSVNGVANDKAVSISVQPTAKSTYNWNSSGEYQWITFFHKNENAEISGSGTYYLNLNSTGSNVMGSIVIVSWKYVSAGTLTVLSSGSQIGSATIPSQGLSVGGAFAMSFDSGSASLTSLKISEKGTMAADADLSNVKIYYETSGACSYEGTESQFGSAQSFNSYQEATFNGNVNIGTSQTCFYVVVDVGNGATSGQTLEIEITNPSSDISVSDGIISPASVVAISGVTTLAAGSLSMDMVDSSGNSVASPSVSFDSKIFSWNTQQSSATLGTSSQKIRINNTTATATWTLSIAAALSPSATWSNGSESYDFNGSSDQGRLRVNASSSTITPQGGCSATGLTKGSAAYFAQGLQDSINIVVAGSSAQTNCYWDITGVELLQDIPASQETGDYNIDMTLTAA